MACQIDKNEQGLIIDVKNEQGKSSTLFRQIFNVPILSLDESLEIYKNTYSSKVKNAGKKEIVRNGSTIESVFTENKSLSKIGTKEQYSNYLNTIFPDSKINDILFHGTKRDFDTFDESQIGTESDRNKTIGDFGQGFYFTSNFYKAEGYSIDMNTGKKGAVKKVLINVTSPLYQVSKNIEEPKTAQQLADENYDSVVISYAKEGALDEVVIPSTSQIHVLGSEEDLRQFQEFLNEPNLVFETPSGNQFSSYQEALQNTPSGEINLKANDVIVGTVNSDTNINTFEGTLNTLIKQGVLTGTRILDVNGDQITIVSGESDSAKQLTSNIVEDISVRQLGQSSVTRLDTGDFIFENNLNTRIIAGEKVKESEIAEMDYEQLKNRFNEDTAIEIETERQFEKDMLPSQLKRRLDTDTEVKTEDELIRSIKNLLNKLSIPITSIVDYEKNYAAKSGGVNPSASALMDITNKIMAFRDGTISREDLIEETMHLIEASLDPALTAGLRANIHNTPEWQEHAKNYYDIYSKEYSGDRIEEMVRREILGKVMANGVATNFELSETDSPVQVSIFQQIRALLDQFFAKVNAYFTDNTQQQIDQLNKDIYVKLLSGELADELDVNQNFGTKFRLYSASTNLNNELVQIQKNAEKALTILESQSYQIAKNDASQRAQLRSARESLSKAGERVEEAGEQTDILSKAEIEKLANAELAATFSYITNVAQKQLTYLQRAVKRNADNNYPFSAEESAVYQNMLAEFDKNILPSITNTLEKKSFRTVAENKILEEVKKVSESIEVLKQNIGKNNDDYKRILVDLLSKRLNLSADKRAFIENKVGGLQEEVGFFFLNFGTLMHSSNIYLNAAGHVATKTDHETRQGALTETLPFIKKLKDLGWLNGKVKDFAKDGFIENRFNDKGREDAIAQVRYQIYKEVSDSGLSFEDFEKKNDFSDLSTEQRQLMDQKFSDWKLENYLLTAMSPEETQERKKRLEGYSEVTQNYERVSSNFYADLMQNAEIINNIPTFTNDMRYDFEQQKKLRTYDKSVYTVYGDLREGIQFRNQQEYETSLLEGLETDIVKLGSNLYASLIPGTKDSGSILSFELTKIDNNRISAIKSNTEEKEFSPKFIETLNMLEPSQAYDFLMLNSYVGYTNEYYDDLNRQSVLDKLEAQLGGDNDWKIQNLIEKISTTSKKMNTILQANRVMNRPSETNFDGMEKSTEIPQIRQYAQDLEDYYSQASTLITRTDEEIEEDNLSETIPNDAFRAYMSDKHLVSQLVYEKDVLDEEDNQNIDKIFSEIVDHATQKNKLKVLELRSFVKDYSNGRVNKIPKSYKRIFSLTEEEYNNMSKEQIFSSMTNELLQYSYTRLLPYFRKSQPTGVDTALNELRAGILSSSEFIQNYLDGQYPFLNISPNYNFQQANDQNNKNPHFQQAKLEGTPMFRTFESPTTLEDVKNKSVDQLYNEGKLNKFVNKDFLKDYGIDLVKLFETGQEIATKNENKFQARQAFLDLQKQTLENYGMRNNHNLYQLPQKEKSKFRKYEDVLSKGVGIRSIVDEYLDYREDEESVGQDEQGNPAKNMIAATIPKRGLRKLRDGVATDELIESFTWINKESNRYKARLRNIQDMLVIKEALLGSQFENNLSVESSNVYKMFEDSMAHNFYGYKETFSKEFQLFGVTGNWGQVLKSFGGLIRFRNLAYNVTIPITSALSGSVQLRIERLVGQRVDVDGLSRANKRFKSTAGDAAREVMDLSATSWLNSMGSKWGWFESEERYNNSAYGKVARGLGRSAYVAHTMFNFPVNPRVGLAVLADHRFLDGRILQYQEFKNENKGKSDKEIREVWKQYKDITDVSIVNDDGVVSYDYAKIVDALNNNMTIEEAKEFMSNAEVLIAGRVKESIQAVDQQISEVDRSIAARNSIFSFITTHRSWLTLATQNKFKKRQFSTVTGRIEEGSWNSLFRVVNQMYKDVRSGKAKDIVNYVKTRWQEGDDTTRKNLIRSVTELGVLNALVALTVLGLKQLDDDDESSYATKVATLFSMRVASEVSSSSLGLPRNLYDTLQQLVVGINTLDLVFEAPDLISNETITRGRYSGLTEQQRYLIKNIPMAKEYNNLVRDIEGNINSYRFFNVEKQGAFDYFTLYNTLIKEEK